MPYINISEDIGVNDFLEECNNDDLNNVDEWMRNNSKKFTGDGDELDIQLNKISLKRLQLTSEEESIIDCISKRLV